VREVLALHHEGARQSKPIDEYESRLVLALFLYKRPKVLAFPAGILLTCYFYRSSLLIRMGSGSLLLTPVLGALRHVPLDLDQVLHERESDVQVQHLRGRDRGYLAYVLFFLELGELEDPWLQEGLVLLNIHVEVLDL